MNDRMGSQLVLPQGSWRPADAGDMRILFFTPRDFGLRNTGAHLRDYYLARELARQDELSWVGFRDPNATTSNHPTTDQGDAEFQRIVLLERGRSYTAGRILRGLIGPMPVTVLNYHRGAAAGDLQSVLRQQAFDVVQLEQIHLAAYLPVLLSNHRSKRPRLVCDWHNIESELMRRYAMHSNSWPRRMYAKRTTTLIERLERRLLSQCDAHLVVSEHERDQLLRSCPQAQVHVVENGVDLGLFAGEAKHRDSIAPTSRNTIVFVGSMDFHANIDAVVYFTRQVWPLIRGSLPELRFVIVGSNPPSTVRELAHIPGVEVTGTVPDVRPYYRQALAAVVPIRVGGGTRLKILEAMAAGVPVVSTSIGAEGLAVRAGQDILLADTPQAMARAIDQLAHTTGMQAELASAGLKLVQSRYDWVAIGSGLREILRSLCYER